MGDHQYRRAGLFFEGVEQGEDLRLDGDVKRGGRFVGNQQFGMVNQRHGNHHALAHAAGKLMRISLETHLCRRDLHFFEDLQRDLHRLCARDVLVSHDRFTQLIAQRKRRIERGHRLLENHRQIAAAQIGIFPRRELAQIVAAKLHLPADDTCAGGQ